MTVPLRKVSGYVLNQVSTCSRLARWAATFVRALSVTLLLASAALAQSNEPKQVLILMQEDLSWPLFRRIDENIRATLQRGSPEGILIYSEHMDRIHFPDPAIQAQRTEWIKRKFANSKLDLIIGVGDVPLDVFPSAPLVYLSPNPVESLPASMAWHKESSCIRVELGAKKTLEAALRFQPNARQVLVIGGSSPSETALLDQVREQIAGFSNRLQITYLTNLGLSEIRKRVRTLGADSIVLFVTLGRDAVGHPLISADVVSKVAAESGAPVYALLDTHLGSGAVGGYIIRFAEMGTRAGEMGLRFLAGEHPEDELASSGYIFDERQLQRWKISEMSLPAGSAIVNRQPNVWRVYRWYILGIISLCVAQALLILGLLRHRAKRKKVEASLAASLTFEHLLSDLSTTFINLPDSQVVATIENSLGRIAQFLRIERITIHEYSRELGVLTPAISWCEWGTEPAPVVLNADKLPWWSDTLNRGESIFVSDLETLPDEASQEREYLRRIHTISIATIALKAGHDFFGCVSFISTKHKITWTDELKKQLKLVGEIVSNALERKSAREAQSRHDLIFESSDDAIISENLDGTILSWNASAERLFGYTRAEAVGQSTRLIIPEELWAEEGKILERTRAGERIEHYETTRVTKRDQKLDLSLTISPLRDSTGAVVGSSIIARDITERKHAVQVLRESEERFRLVANTAPVLIWMAGTDKLCTFFNQNWLNFTGRALTEELGSGWASGVHPDDLGQCLETYSAAFDSRRQFEMEYRLRRFDGVYRWLVDLGVPRFESDGTFCGYVGSCVDITERKTSEESLHQLTGRLIRAQEEERARIARELHDDFSQRLALLSIGLGQLWKKLPESEHEERASIVEMLRGLKEISTDIHSLSHELHSSKLEHVGLVPALQGLCREISEKHHVAVHFLESGLPPNLSKDVALCLFRVAQEALANVVKHSEANEAKLELESDAEGVSLRISDSGSGFDPQNRINAMGLGLIGMSERLRLAGGKLTVNSEVGRGTEVFAEVPISVPANEFRVMTHAAGD